MTQTTISPRKSASAFRTIGEAAEEVGVAQHVLRFWEQKFSQIKPVKRRGRRYYRPEDIDLLCTIRTLLYDRGFTIRGAQQFFKSGEVNLPTPANTAQPALVQDTHMLAMETPFSFDTNAATTEEDVSLARTIATLKSLRVSLKDALEG